MILNYLRFSHNNFLNLPLMAKIYYICFKNENLAS